jgi:hypothetical protein
VKTGDLQLGSLDIFDQNLRMINTHGIVHSGVLVLWGVKVTIFIGSVSGDKLLRTAAPAISFLSRVNVAEFFNQERKALS